MKENKNEFYVSKYDPYRELKHNIDDEYFEDKFLEYFNSFKSDVLFYQQKYGKDLTSEFSRIVKEKNDEMVDFVLKSYSTDKETNDKNIVKLKNNIRKVKDNILASEEPDMKRMQMIDDKVANLIDSFSYQLGILNDEEIDKVFSKYRDIFTLYPDRYSFHIDSFKDKVHELSVSFRKNYSVKTSSKKIEELNRRMNKIIDKHVKTNELDLDYAANMQEITIMENSDMIDLDYDTWNAAFHKKIDYLKKVTNENYSSNMAKKMNALIDEKAGQVLDEVASRLGFSLVYDKLYESIFDSYKPEELDIFDIDLYSSEEERDLEIEKYKKMTLEERNVFEMRMYDQYIRKFKRRIREFNKEIRRVYSKKYSDKVINVINRNADRLIRTKAKKIGKPIPKNPWIVRKYLYADTSNFVSDSGLKIRKIINPVMRQVIKLGMKNEIVIEERAKLDPNKQYIFVSTHYFTEDVIGLFSAVGRQAHMVMGTTDQIENNPLMIFAKLLGFIHVDRMDSLNRQECFEKQNQAIERGTSFMNYVAGSWENSENELQPLSFSGPYKTSVLKNVEIVPVASYLVEEDKKMYVRFGEPMDLSKYTIEEGNEIIRDTLASMHYKQLEKYSKPIGSLHIDNYGITHDLPYDQRTYYMDSRGNEYWNQPWSRPFAKEEIGIRTKKDVTEEEVYKFVDNLSREKLVELSSILSEPLVRIDELERYNIVDYLDRNYDKFKENHKKNKVRKRG